MTERFPECPKCNGFGGWGRLYNGPATEPSVACETCKGDGTLLVVTHEELRRLANAVSDVHTVEGLERGCRCGQCRASYCGHCSQQEGHAADCVVNLANEFL